MTANEHQEKIATARADFLDSLLRTFDGPAGKSVLAWLHSTAGTRAPCFIPGDRDPNAAAFRDGRKSLVWEIEANLATARQTAHAAARGDMRPAISGAPKTRARARARKQGA